MAKTDWAKYNTYKDLNEIEDKITFIFKQAEDELQDSADKAWDVYYNIDAELANKYNSGSITYSEYQAGLKAAAVKGEKIDSLISKISTDLAGAYNTAWEYVNNKTPEIYALNYNYTAYTIETLSDSIDFNLWDEATVRRLVVKEPKLLPNYSKAKSLKINMAKTQRAVRNAVLSGILQGKSVDKIASDIQSKITTMSKNSAIRAARTAVTSAQNAGRLDAMWAAKDMGIDVQKQWVATLDSVTRPTHGMLDGSHVALGKKFSNGCSYPGDPSGPSEEVYNCRCTLISYIPGVTDQDDVERWSKDSSGTKSYVTNTTYSQWAAQKLSSNKTVAAKNTLASKKTAKTASTTTKKSASSSASNSTSTQASSSASNVKMSKDGYPIYTDSNGNPYSTTGRTYTNLRQNNNRSDLADWESEYYANNGGAGYFTRSSCPNTYTYTSNAFTKINGHLRGNRKQYGAEASKIEKISEGISAEMSKTSLTSDMVTIRGVGSIDYITGATSSLEDAKAAVGTVYTDHGFFSTSALMSGGFSGLRIKITVPKETSCMYVENFSAFKGGSEVELLLDKETSFLVTGVEESGNGRYTLLMEVLP